MRTSLGTLNGLLGRQRARLSIGSNWASMRTEHAELEHRVIQDPGLESICPVVHELIDAHPNLRVDVHLSGAWSRVLTLPAIAQLTREERWRNYARARFEQIYSDSAQAWNITVSYDWPGRDRLAVAWPAALREQLAQHANVRSARVALLEYLGILLAQIPGFSGCLAQIESGGASLVLLVGGRLRRARWCRFEDAEGLAATVGAEWASVGAMEANASSEAALALAPAAPQVASEQSRTAALLASCMGASRAFALPHWA